MPHPVFVAHVHHIERLRAERILDAAQAATAMHAPASWWDRMTAMARGVVQDIAAKAAPLFTFNGRAVNTSDGLRRAFAEGVSTRVES